MADAQGSLEEARAETARELNVDPQELAYIDEDWAAMSEEVPEGGTEDDAQEQLDGLLLRTFECRHPAYRYINHRWWLYYYARCDGPYYRILRSRVNSIHHIGYCGVPTRRYKVFYQ